MMNAEHAGYEIKMLQRHKYAPELNSLHLKDGRVIRTPGATTLKAAVEILVDKKIPLVKPLSLIERVEKEIQSLGHETGKIIQIASGMVTVFTVEILNTSGDPDNIMTVIVNPDNDIMNIMSIDEVRELIY